MTTLRIPPDFKISVNLPYAEGHVLTATEAQAFNQYYIERLRNRLIHEIKAGRGEVEGLQSIADAFVIVTRNRLDPVVEEAKRVARKMIEEALNKQKVNLRSVKGYKMEAAIDKLLKSRPEIIAEARNTVEANARVFDSVLSEVA